MAKKASQILKKIFKWTGIILGAVVLLVALLFGVLTILEYRPKDVEALTPQGNANATVTQGQTIRLVTWNLGYGALGEDADFFMDGGKMVNTATKQQVLENMNAIADELISLSPDVVFLQETDTSSTRSHKINEVQFLKDALPDMSSTFALNFKAAFVPYPLPPIGKVESGILTLSSFQIKEAQRIQLPCPFKWPLRIANLKRCLSVNRIPVSGTDKELVLVNLHLEAFDSGEGKEKQTRMLREVLDRELEKGNYVIAGGDFNQVFSNSDTEAWKVPEGYWKPGLLNVKDFSNDYTFNQSSAIPTGRSLDKPLAGADRDSFIYYLIDGFIISSNIEMQSLVNIDKEFKNTDHNPVMMEVVLK